MLNWQSPQLESQSCVYTEICVKALQKNQSITVKLEYKNVCFLKCKVS